MRPSLDLSNTHNDYNLLIDNQYVVQFDNAKTLDYAIDSFIVPSVSMESVRTPIQNNSIKMAGNTVEYADVTFTFKLMKDMKGYIHILRWLRKFANVSQHDRDLIKGNQGRQIHVNYMSDFCLHILDNNNNPQYMLKFFNAFPTFLSEIPFNTNNTDATPIFISASFAYQYFDFED